MRIDYSVPAHQRTGVSIYYDDYKKRMAVDYSKMKPTSAFRRNNPHPPENFLEPRRLPQEGAALQSKVRQSVRNYLNDIYKQTHQSGPSDVLAPHLFRPSLDERGIDDCISRPSSQPPSTFHPFYRNLTQENPYYRNSRSLSVTGCQIGRPTRSVEAERDPPPELEGESKRDRSVRIKEKIKEETRLKTPQPQREVWQKSRSSPVPPQKKAHWVGSSSNKNISKPTRVTSAPPGVKGYTYYPQGNQSRHKMDESEDMTSRLEAWSHNASNYEKEVIFNMLKQVSARGHDNPNTPTSEDFRRIVDGPAADYHRPGVTQFASGPAGGEGATYHKKQRKTHSAPIKRMGGLVAAATQRPLHDQRVYRLKGQDTRLDPSPVEERRLKKYMNHLEGNMVAPSKESLKYASVPMHTHAPRKTGGAQDYQCKVSFFQSVRSPFKKHFIIHPDFTSESMKKRKPVSHTITHFRY